MTFKNERRLLGLTQEQLAEKLGVNVRTVNNWERAKFKPNPDCCKKLTDLGFSTESVLNPLGE